MRTMEEDNFNRKDLFKKVMNKKWFYVIIAYENNQSVRRAKLTRTGHTVLHLAVSQKRYYVVSQLVKAIKDDEASEILKLENDVGDTPLHVAAALGLAKICCLLAEKCKELVVDARNKVGETPLYVSVHHGKKEAFFMLQNYVPTSLMSDDFAFCRSGDGNTILHAAIHGTYFELAIEIINLYPKLVNFNNDMGQSPLHLLANKPLVFKSGSPSRDIFKELLYSCIEVDRLEPKYHSKDRKKAMQDEFSRISRISSLHGRFESLRQNKPNPLTFFGLAAHSSSEDINQDGQERDEEYGKHVRSTVSSLQENYNTVFGYLKIVINFLMVPLKIAYTAFNFLKIVINFLKIVINFLMVPLKIAYTAFNFLKIVINFLMVPLGMGIPKIEVAKIEKTMHEHTNQVMKELINKSSYWEFHDESDKINTPDEESSTNRSESSVARIMQIEIEQKAEDKEAGKPKRDSPILVAAKMGIVEMVENILDVFPIAIEDLDSNHKNIILLSAEHRQLRVYKHILEREQMLDSVFAVVDEYGNNALHLAASATRNNSPRVIKGPALQMLWEIKWFKFVKNSMEPSFFQDYNNKGQTANEIFSETHGNLIKEGREWMRNTSQSCSLIATIIVTVAFSFSIAVPGGVDQTTGFPILSEKLAFSVFTNSAAVALFFSIISMLIFLNTLTIHYQEWHFESYVPGMLSIGLISLFTSIISMLISFIASYILVMDNYKSLPIFVCSCIPVILIMLQLSVYKDMARAVPSDVP